MSKITLYGFCEFMHNANDDLFSQLHIPESIDKDALIDNILLRGGEFEVLYASPIFTQSAIGVWSKKWYRTFDKWVKALEIEYDPLFNYDRTEEWTDTTNGTTQNTGTSKDTGTVTNSSTNTNTGTVSNIGTTSGTNETINTKSAYDSEAFVNDTKAHTTDSGSTNATQTTNLTSTDSGTVTNDLTRTDNLTQTDAHTTTHTARLYGNIGVTTSQMMLQSELDVAKFNLIDNITDMFLQEFVLPIY